MCCFKLYRTVLSHPSNLKRKNIIRLCCFNVENSRRATWTLCNGRIPIRWVSLGDNDIEAMGHGNMIRLKTEENSNKSEIRSTNKFGKNRFLVISKKTFTCKNRGCPKNHYGQRRKSFCRYLHPRFRLRANASDVEADLGVRHTRVLL